MTILKVGDKVRAIDSYYGKLEVGKVYTVTKAWDQDGSGYGLVMVEGLADGAYNSRFELVTDYENPVKLSTKTKTVVESVTITLSADDARELLRDLEHRAAGNEVARNLQEALKGANLS